MGGSFGHGVFGEGEGVIWMGENEHRTALVHGRKAGVLLRSVVEVDGGGAAEVDL